LSARWRRNRRRFRKLDFTETFKRKNTVSSLRLFKNANVPLRRWKVPLKYRAPRASGKMRLKDPEPLIDVIDEKDDVVVIAEFAGFDRKNLNIRVDNQRLILSAEASERKYYKSLNLPSKVISNTMRLVHRNGVLEIRVKKTIEEKPLDKVAG
jgi:HSP20 family molecular chaperone IbpA